MRFGRLVVGLASLLAACGPDRAQVAADQARTEAASAAAVAQPAVASAPPGAVPVPPPPPGAEPPGFTGDTANQSRLTAACANGETIELRFFPDVGVAVLVRGGGTTELQFEPGSSGLRYTAPDLVVTGKGRSYTIAEAGAPELVCTAQG
ncbi:hypothetical protein [Thermaurantiacus sp.]